MSQDPIECVKCSKVLDPKKDTIVICDMCRDRYCQACSIDSMARYSTTSLCNKCATSTPGDWLVE